METRTTSAEELQQYAADFVRALTPNTQATLVTLSGELGAGKTTWVQGAARALGVAETVSSPTFVIEKIYQLSDQKFGRLIHIDAYRLKSSHELEVLGWAELLADPQSLILLEWPERVTEILPKGAIALRFDIDNEHGGRIITTTYGS